MFDFYKYIETFNAGDDKLMLDRFWVNDLEVWSGRGEKRAFSHRGRKASSISSTSRTMVSAN